MKEQALDWRGLVSGQDGPSQWSGWARDLSGGEGRPEGLRIIRKLSGTPRVRSGDTRDTVGVTSVGCYDWKTAKHFFFLSGLWDHQAPGALDVQICGCSQPAFKATGLGLLGCSFLALRPCHWRLLRAAFQGPSCRKGDTKEQGKGISLKNKVGVGPSFHHLVLTGQNQPPAWPCFLGRVRCLSKYINPEKLIVKDRVQRIFILITLNVLKLSSTRGK